MAKEEEANDLPREEEAESRRKKRKHRKHKHKRRHAEQPEGDEEENREDEGGKRRKKVSSTGKRKKRTRKDFENDAELQRQTDEQVGNLLSEMVQAAQQDKENKLEGELAAEKLRLLPKIKSELKKRHYHEPFLSKNGLAALSFWIQRHEDRSYPCLDILEGVLDICDELPITTDNLLESGRELGREINRIYKTTESEKLRNKAKGLIDKWSREIYGIDIDCQNLSEKERGYIQYLRHVNATRGKKSQIATAEEQKGAADFEEVKVASSKGDKKAEAPIKGTLAAISKIGFDFIQRPVSEINIDKKKEVSNVSDIAKIMVQIKREGKKSSSSRKITDIV